MTRVTSRSTRKRKTRKTQKGGLFGLTSKKKPLSSAQTTNTYNYGKNTEDRASALAWLKREEEIMNTATSVDDAVHKLVALNHEPTSEPESISGEGILDEPLSDLQGAMSIVQSQDTPTSILKKLKEHYPNMYSSLSSIINYMGYHLPNSPQEGGASGLLLAGQAAGTSQTVAGLSMGGMTAAMASTICLMIIYIVVGICIALKTSRVLYRISKYIFKIMLFNYKKRIHLQNNNDLTKFPYMEPKMQPLLRWWGSRMTGYKIFPNIGGFIKPGEERGWGLETKKLVTTPNLVKTTQNPLYNQAIQVTWDKYQSGIDSWYMSSDGKRADQLPAGAILVTWTKVKEGKDKWYESSNGKSVWGLHEGAILNTWTKVIEGKETWYELSNGESVWDLPGATPVTWKKVIEGNVTWYESSQGKSVWDLPAGAILK